MIFVTVGAQMPFDRLIRAVDAWAARHRRDDVFAQIGPGAWKPLHIRWQRFLNHTEYRQCVFEARCVIAHAGIGSIVTALEYARPMILMPRRGDLKETRNDHQFGTAQRFARTHGVSVAMSETELLERLNQLPVAALDAPIASHASFELLNAVRQFVHAEPHTAATDADAATARLIHPAARVPHAPAARRRAA